MPFAVLCRRASFGLPEYAREVLRVMYSYPTCDIRHGFVADEQFLCEQGHPHGGYVLVDALAGILSKTDLKKPA